MSTAQPSFDFVQSFVNPVRRKRKSTSQLAHEKVKPSKRQLQILLTKSYFEGAFSADDWAIEHGYSILTVRPRVSGMNKAQMLHRVGFGLTVDGNDRDKFTLFPYIRIRMERLAAEFGLDAAIEQILTQFNPEKFAVPSKTQIAVGEMMQKAAKSHGMDGELEITVTR
jgi:hypothetical protein